MVVLVHQQKSIIKCWFWKIPKEISGEKFDSEVCMPVMVCIPACFTFPNRFWCEKLYICSLNEKFPSGLTKLPPRAKNHLIKTPNQGMRITLSSKNAKSWHESHSFELLGLSRWLLKQYISIAVGCPNKGEDKFLFFKTPHTSEIGPRRLQTGTDLKAFCLRTSLQDTRRWHKSVELWK